MGALAADPLLSLIDTALVGRLGAPALAALGIDAAVFATVFWLFNFLAYGTTTEVARARAAGRGEEAARRVVQAMWLALALGAAVTAVLTLAAPLIVGAMGAASDVREPALAYLRVRALAAAPALVVMAGHGAFRGLKDTRTPLYVTVALNAADAVLSWLLIYPAGLGVAGAAWGTVAAQTAAALAFLLLLRRRLAPSAAGVPLPMAPDPRAMRAILHVSRDLFLRTAALLAGLLLSTAAAARMGVATVAAHQVVREVWVLLALALDGFAIAGQALVAGALGAGDRLRARADTTLLLRWGVGVGVLLGVVQLALVGPLPELFTADPAVLGGIRGVWLLLALLQPAGGVVFVLDGVLMGAHDYRFLRWTTAVASLGVLAPVSFLALWLGWGLHGIWAAMAGMVGVRMVALLLRLRRWESVATAPPGAR